VTLLSGSAGAGKSVLALELLYRAAARGEKGIFVALEESPEQIRANGASFDWFDPESENVAFVHAELLETVTMDGDFDLNGLLAVVGAKTEELGSSWVVFDGLDVLLAHLSNESVGRREVARIRNWITERDQVGLLTAKSGAGSGAHSLPFLQFAVDGVIRLRHQLIDGSAFRTIQVSKYRGSNHATDEFPCVVTSHGLLISTRGQGELDHLQSDERVSIGLSELDELLEGGVHRASATLLSGIPGTAKTTLGGAFVDAACRRGESSLFVSFDESAPQIRRNLRSVGIDLQPHCDSGLLRMLSFRTRSANLERHIEEILGTLDRIEGRALVVDPISALEALGSRHAARDAATYLIDACKERGVTLLLTSLRNRPGGDPGPAAIGISSTADTWIHLEYLDTGGERNRTLTILKSRGTAHSNRTRELLLGKAGLELADIYTADGEVLLGTHRWEREQRLYRERAARQHALRQKHADAMRELRELRRQLQTMADQRDALEKRISSIQTSWEAQDEQDRSFEEMQEARREQQKSAD